MTIRILTTLFLAGIANGASADIDLQGIDLSGYSVGIAAGHDRYSTGVPDGSDRNDNAYLNSPMDYMVGLVVRKARHHSRRNLDPSHTRRYENSEMIYRLGLNRDRVLLGARYRF